jgi:DHA1 family bicyclomycin/chloramphenicol resistance-like MFS transporter
MSFKEFVALMAGLMAINSLAIDSMLPALGQIGHSLGIVEDNQRQWIITAYLLGLGAGQIVWGPLADRFGRRPILLIGIAIYSAFSLMAFFATSFESMIVARLAQGGGAAAALVLSVSIVRDCYSGRAMGRVMSLVFMVFLAAPVVAPASGQLVLLFAEWPWIFAALVVLGLALMVWTWARLPETLHPQDRLPLKVGRVVDAFGSVIGNRIAVGYMLAMSLVIGGLLGFINSAQQIFIDVYHIPNTFTLVFACMAGFMSLASLLSARVVERVGLHRTSHTALVVYIVVGALHYLVARTGTESLVTFAIMQSIAMASFGLMYSNFGAMSLEPLGEIAGTASSVQGFFSMTIGSLIGFGIGQQFDGTVAPLALGGMVTGLGALAIVLVSEKGRLFRSVVPA